jgi:RNA 3'-terminal phosphate cyclase
MQVALPCAFFAPAPVTLILLGGTDAIMAPPIDYMKLVCVQLNLNQVFITKVLLLGYISTFQQIWRNL